MAKPDSSTQEPPAQDTKSALDRKLDAYADKATGTQSTTLPETGIVVTWPEFKPHSVWSKAMRLSKKNPMSVTDNYLPLLCTFEGSKMTLEDFKRRIPTDDILHLTKEVMGDEDDEDEDEAGNALP